MPSRRERTVPRNRRQERSAAGWGESLDLAYLFLPRAQMMAFGLTQSGLLSWGQGHLSNFKEWTCWWSQTAQFLGRSCFSFGEAWLSEWVPESSAACYPPWPCLPLCRTLKRPRSRETLSLEAVLCSLWNRLSQLPATGIPMALPSQPLCPWIILIQDPSGRVRGKERKKHTSLPWGTLFQLFHVSWH